jgi:hypothetical protein
VRTPPAPRLDKRRTAEFSAELRERARAWIPSWGFADNPGDFGRALLEIGARFSSEVAERLDGAGEKMRRGFFDWLGVRGAAARPARMPLVFKLAETARDAVPAPAATRLQADAAGAAVVFETESELRLVPGHLEVVVGVDADRDAVFLPPPGLSDLEPIEPLPTRWQLKSFAAAGAKKLQLDPESGLVAEMVLEADGAQYRVVQVDKDIVTIEPALETELAQATTLHQATSFAPFAATARNRQEHALYLGHMELLNIEAAATLEIVGAQSLSAGVSWQYWGKVDPKDEVGWQPLTLAPAKEQQPDAAVLKKPKGVVEPWELEGTKSRWIRAFSTNAEGPVFSTDALKLRINCSDKEQLCPREEMATPGPTAEAMANNTPLVLSEPFYPLGREPRQFDAFYLGSAEAFSKKGANVQVCFEMSDATCLAYTPVPHGSFANRMLAGVGKDRGLHLLEIDLGNGKMKAFRGPLRPPQPDDPTAPSDETAPINLNPRCRPVIWNDPPASDDFYVAVAAGGDIWVWHENALDAKSSGWKRHSGLTSLPGAPELIEDIILFPPSGIDLPNRLGAVLSRGRLRVREGAVWKEKSGSVGDYASLAPIYNATGTPTDEMVAVSDTAPSKLYRLKSDGSSTALAAGVAVDAGKPLPGSPVKVGGIRPAARFGASGQLQVIAVSDNRDTLLAAADNSPPQKVPLPSDAKAIGAAVAITPSIDPLQVSIGAQRATGGAFVVSWAPTFNPNDKRTVLLESPIPDASGAAGGTPLVVGTWLVVPGSRGDAFVAPYTYWARLNLKGGAGKVIKEGVILPATASLAQNVLLSVMPKVGSRMERKLVSDAITGPTPTEVLHIVESPFGDVAQDPQLIAYRPADIHKGTYKTATTFEIPSADSAPPVGAVLRIEDPIGTVAFCEVMSSAAGSVAVKTTTPLPDTAGVGDELIYRLPNPVVGRLVPVFEPDPALDGYLPVWLLDRASLYFFEPVRPSPQRATGFGIDGGSGQVGVVALGARWTSASTSPSPVNPTDLIIDAVIGPWSHQLADSSSNPALSWEYWNGKGWWSLPIAADQTERLAITGVVKFTVPSDIAESDWAGKTNFWIRARLVGGDYGHEEVKVISEPIENGKKTQQTVERSTANIKAPLVLDLHLAYRICDEVPPAYVFAQDSGTVRNQSDANATPGAIVEAFVPVGVMLGRLSNGAVSAQTTGGPPDCDCHSAAAAVAMTSAPTMGRALFIGLDTTLSGAPVNVLLLVEQEGDYGAFSPLTIEALVADRFVPIVADDATRGLGESGLLSMTFAISPTPRELFGKTLSWLRLTPAASATPENWRPTLRGAYLNAVWASAAETLTRELLGSSEGAPDLTLQLARPPLLQDSLELRVREPLGDEERAALLEKHPGSVLTDPDGLPGDWVLWKPVVDPADEPAAARVYALDEAIGEIRFGDGKHGAIPPIGRDSIVAFQYRRTEPGPSGSDSVPANAITARTALNLVSPVESVEAVFAADQAAGGAPPETDERVLRFGGARLRHRDRAVTVQDLEDLALQSSPDIVQARCFPRRGHVRLVIVMRGKEPRPKSGQVRELRRLLLAEAPPSLSAPKVLRIEEPAVRRLRVELRLRVARLDHAGALGRTAKARLEALFDTATGGSEHEGWALGDNPSEGDIAQALLDAPHLEGIVSVVLRESEDNGIERPWPEKVKPTELVMLAEDAVRIQFEPVEEVA